MLSVVQGTCWPTSCQHLNAIHWHIFSFFAEEMLIVASWKLAVLFSMKERLYVPSLCHRTLNVCMYKTYKCDLWAVVWGVVWFFYCQLYVLQGSVFRDVWTSKYVDMKEICSTLKCHVIMASLEHAFSVKVAMTFFVVCGFFLYIAAYCTDYECKWKTEYETITYAFYNIRR